MSLGLQIGASLDDLMRVEGKAELISGRIVTSMPSCEAASSAAFRIAMRLDEYARKTGIGVAYPDGIGYGISPALSGGRQSFCPDASYHVGPRPNNRMRFIEDAPIFAVEVRSENDYGPSAESDLAAKRADYFEAGTAAVGDVDPLAQTIAVYRTDPTHPAAVYVADEEGEAEPAVPGWRIAVGDLFA